LAGSGTSGILIKASSETEGQQSLKIHEDQDDSTLERKDADYAKQT
jgi:hypothetical protein